MWTCCSDDNPDMKFFSCSTCKFFKWYDNMIRDKAWEVSVGLRDRERELNAKNKQIKIRIKEISYVKGQVRKSCNEQLAMEDEAMSAEKKKNGSTYNSHMLFLRRNFDDSIRMNFQLQQEVEDMRQKNIALKIKCKKTSLYLK